MTAEESTKKVPKMTEYERTAAALNAAFSPHESPDAASGAAFWLLVRGRVAIVVENGKIVDAQEAP